MKIGIIGLGLIGGSMAKDLRSRGHDLSGWDTHEHHRKMALDLGLIDHIMDLDEMCQLCQLIIVATPVSSIASVVSRVLSQLDDDQAVMDVGSTKRKICEAVRSHPRRELYVACHPLAGTEYSGPTAAITNLFHGKKNIICELEASSKSTAKMVIETMASLGMQNLLMSAEDHDRHAAYVSHLSHISAFALGTTVLNIEKDESQIFNMAGTGFSSTVRLAKSNPDTWSSIFSDNRPHLLEALDGYLHELQKWRDLLADDDQASMTSQIQDANRIGRILDGIELNVLKIS